MLVAGLSIFSMSRNAYASSVAVVEVGNGVAFGGTNPDLLVSVTGVMGYPNNTGVCVIYSGYDNSNVRSPSEGQIFSIYQNFITYTGGWATSTAYRVIVGDYFTSSCSVLAQYAIYDHTFYYPFDADLMTRIISLSPENGTTTASTSVTFNLDYYINESDLNGWLGVVVNLENIDQNVVFSELSRNAYHFIDNHFATTSGEFTFSTTTVLDEGNYRVSAYLTRSYLGLNDFWSGINTISIDEQHNQFIVVASTTLGNLSQSLFGEVNSLLNSTTTSTSTEALRASCVPWSGGFAVDYCLTYLFVPSSEQINSAMISLKDGILIRVPVGYVTRFISIISDSATTSLPTVSYTFATSSVLSMIGTISFDPFGALNESGNILHSAISDQGGGTVWDILGLIVKIAVYLGLVLMIIHDVTGIIYHK